MNKKFVKGFAFVLFFIIMSSILVIIATCVKKLEGFIPQYMNHPSKCFDCEQDIINRYGVESAWRAQPTKLFSAETEGVAQTGTIAGGYLGKTLKYY
jgi:hypothetical protein